MDGKKSIAGLLAGTAFIVGVGSHENFDFKTQEDQQRFVQRPSSRAQMLVIGRHDHSPEQWPSAAQTLRGVQTLITTPAANRLVIFDGLQEKSTFSDHLVKPVTYTAWIR